jgi:uncharacterized protein (TIGR03663 family)
LKWKFGENHRLEVWLGLFLLAASALVLRLWHIEDRPMHTDEAVHGVILGEMLETGTYRYSPVDYHGPTLYYLTYPILRVLGLRSLSDLEEWHLRMVSAIIGSATILSLGFWASEFGAIVLWGAGALLAFSAPFVYYQRYFIHEGLFVLLSLLLLLTTWRFFRATTVQHGIWLGLVAGLFFATKETASLVVAALIIAGVVTWLWRFSFPEEEPQRHGEQKDFVPGLLWAIGLFLLIFIVFYSSFGANPHGLLDGASSFLRFTHRAEGEGHAKPWWTYLAWIFVPDFYTVPWSGWIIGVLGALGIYARGKELLVRFLALFTLTTLGIYSLIPYKTPWLELNILAPACLLAGIGIAFLIEKRSMGLAIILLLSILVLPLLGLETNRLCFQHPADARNPLAYSPTVGDVENLVHTIDQIAAKSPAGHSLVIEVVSEDYWPLPWYLRHYAHVGYWNEIPDHLKGDVIITSPTQMEDLLVKLGPGWQAQYFGLRPEVLAVLLSHSSPP